jgi:hypothetical protein
VLFLVALAAVYAPRDWRSAAWVVSAFTVGHSLTLALAVGGVLPLSGALVEFLIPLTIVAAGVDNLLAPGGTAAASRRRARPALAATFGLVHGAGFAGYLRSVLVDRVAVPLLGFNLGVELGQLVVLAAAVSVLAGVDRLLARVRLPSAASPLRMRTVAVSAAVALVAARWAVERTPW